MDVKAKTDANANGNAVQRWCLNFFGASPLECAQTSYKMLLALTLTFLLLPFCFWSFCFMFDTSTPLPPLATAFKNEISHLPSRLRLLWHPSPIACSGYQKRACEIQVGPETQQLNKSHLKKSPNDEKMNNPQANAPANQRFDNLVHGGVKNIQNDTLENLLAKILLAQERQLGQANAFAALADILKTHLAKQVKANATGEKVE
jgi:hypothetical protein